MESKTAVVGSPPVTEQRALHVKQDFTRKRTRHLIGLLAGVVAFAALALLNAPTPTEPAAARDFIQTAVVAIAIGGAVFVLWNWRCPSCRGYLGRTINPRFCPRCGVRFR